MIFVTVGTHEQGMDRLFKELDRLIEEKIINDEVISQIGYSDYIPKNYEYRKMISYDDMDDYIKRADIVITHGGPGSIFHALKYDKIPIVVPRNPKFKEHIDEHQVLFVNKLEKEKRVIAVYNIKELSGKIENYSKLKNEFNCSNLNNNKFIKEFSNLINNLI